MKDLILPLVVAAVLFFFLYKIMQQLGLLDTKEDRKGKKVLSSNAFDPNFYKGKSGVVKLLTRATTKEAAKKIWEAKGYVYDQDGQAIAEFRKMPSKEAISFLSEIFSQQYNRDLAEYLQFMSEDSQAILFQIVQNLPAGK